MQQQKGLILVELIVTIVLVGIIATFTSFFLYTGFNGYLRAKTTADGALNAQRALDRITLELRNITDISGTPSSTSVTYKNEELSGTRTLKYESNQLIININNTDHTLLEDVTTFNLTFTYLNLDDDTSPPAQEVARIDAGFRMSEVRKEFKARIFPRNMVKKTW